MAYNAYCDDQSNGSETLDYPDWMFQQGRLAMIEELVRNLSALAKESNYTMYLSQFISWLKDYERGGRVMERSQVLQQFPNAFADKFNISDEFVSASDHKHDCTCAKCLDWWIVMGPDPDTGKYGPFGDALPDRETYE